MTSQKRCLITQNKTLTKCKHGFSSSWLSLSSSWLSLSVCVRICSLPLDSRLAASGMLLNSLRQSLESDTGVNHHSLANCFPARLRARSPLSYFGLPTPPSPQKLSSKVFNQFFFKGVKHTSSQIKCIYKVLFTVHIISWKTMMLMFIRFFLIYMIYSYI